MDLRLDVVAAIGAGDGRGFLASEKFLSIADIAAVAGDKEAVCAHRFIVSS